MKILFAHCDILVGENFELIKDGYLLVEGKKITYIGKEKPNDKVDLIKNLNNHMLMPGLFNLHTHTPMTLLRGIGSGLPLDRWLNEKIFPIEDKLISQDFAVGSDVAIMEMLACGTVSFSDMYAEPQITAEQAIKAGIKANLNRPIVGFDKNEPYSDNVRVKESLEFFKNYNHAGEDLIRAEFSIHAEYTNYDELTANYAQDCLAMNAQMHIHLAETEKEFNECIERHGKTPTQWFNDLKVFENKTIAAHCLYLTDEDISILKEKNVTCVHNPSSNMKLGSGFMPISKLVSSTINVALGTDGAASNNNLNMLEEMHLASIIHNGYTKDPTALQAIDILKFATQNGAFAQSRENCGTLAVGNFADIVAINMDKPHLMPNLDAISTLIYSSQASDVAMTMVNGKILYENGIYHTIDSEKVKYEMKKSILRLYNI